METNINLVIEDFKQSVFDNLNNLRLPPSVSYYVMKDIFNEVEAGYIGYINQARREAAAQAAAAQLQQEEVLKAED